MQTHGLAASTVALPILARSALAASPPATVFDEFQSDCLNHRNDKAAQIAAAKAGG